MTDLRSVARQLIEGRADTRDLHIALLTADLDEARRQVRDLTARVTMQSEMIDGARGCADDLAEQLEAAERRQETWRRHARGWRRTARARRAREVAGAAQRRELLEQLSRMLVERDRLAERVRELEAAARAETAAPAILGGAIPARAAPPEPPLPFEPMHRPTRPYTQRAAADNPLLTEPCPVCKEVGREGRDRWLSGNERGGHITQCRRKHGIAKGTTVPVAPAQEAVHAPPLA